MARLGPPELLNALRRNLQLPEANKARIRRTGMPTLTVLVEEAEVSILGASWEPGRYRLEILDGTGNPIPGAGKVLEALEEVREEDRRAAAEVFQEVQRERQAEAMAERNRQHHEAPGQTDLATTRGGPLQFPTVEPLVISPVVSRSLSASEAVGQAQEIRDLTGALVESMRIGAAREQAVLKWAGQVAGYAFEALGTAHGREVQAIEAAGDAVAKRAAVEVAAELGQAPESEAAALFKTLGDVATAWINRPRGADGKPAEKPKPPPPPPGL